MPVLPELKYAGQSIERCNYAEYEYKGLDITLHLTVMGGTRLRLEWYKDDPAKWKLICDWCLGNDGILTDGYLVIGFAIILYCIDNHLTGELPFASDPRPVWNDTEFIEWFKAYVNKTDISLFHAVRERVFADVDREGFIKRFVKSMK